MSGMFGFLELKVLFHHIPASLSSGVREIFPVTLLYLRWSSYSSNKALRPVWAHYPAAVWLVLHKSVNLRVTLPLKCGVLQFLLSHGEVSSVCVSNSSLKISITEMSKCNSSRWQSVW